MNTRDKVRAFVAKNEKTKKRDLERYHAKNDMLNKTLAQGKKMAYAHVESIIEGRISHWWKFAGSVICPQWYKDLWFGSLRMGLWTVNAIWQVASRVCLFKFQRGFADFIRRGTHYAHLKKTGDGFVVKMKVYQFFKVVYECDFDVRSGRVSEVYDHPGKGEKKEKAILT